MIEKEICHGLERLNPDRLQRDQERGVGFFAGRQARPRQQLIKQVTG